MTALLLGAALFTLFPKNLFLIPANYIPEGLPLRFRAIDENAALPVYLDFVQPTGRQSSLCERFSDAAAVDELAGSVLRRTTISDTFRHRLAGSRVEDFRSPSARHWSNP